MTRMQRLQPWLMSGIARVTLSVALFGLQINLDRFPNGVPLIDLLRRVDLARWAYWPMIAAAFLIPVGWVKEIGVPTVRWWFGRQGRLYRELDQKIAEAYALIEKEPAVDFPQLMQWQAAVREILERNFGKFCTEIKELGYAADPTRTPYQTHNAQGGSSASDTIPAR